MKAPFALSSTLLALAALAPAQPLSLTTLIASNNARSTAGSTAMFDIAVLNPAGLRIVALDVNSTTAASSPVTLDIYLTPLTYVGKELTPAAWVKVSSGKGIAAGREFATPVDIEDFFLAPGVYGLGVHYTDCGNAYTNGTGSNQFYSNTDMSLTLGVATAALFSSTLFNPRVWNGTVYYATPVNAVYGVMGSGCAGTNGVPRLAAAPGSLPKIGGVFTLDAANLPLPVAGALVLIGIDKKNWGPFTLPFDLAPAGAPGCRLYTGFVFSLGLPNANGSGSLPLALPGDPVLLGAPLQNQVLVVDPPANTLGVTLSNAGEGQIGR